MVYISSFSRRNQQNISQHIIKTSKFSRKKFCRVCLRKIRGKWWKSAFVMPGKRSFSDSDPPPPPPTPLNFRIFALLFAFPRPIIQGVKGDCQIFKASLPSEVITFKGQSDHFKGRKWSLTRSHRCRTAAKLRFSAQPTGFSSVRNRVFGGIR